ncbi:transmembrane transport protein [Helicobacter cholecystus]|uniref:NCS2 family permease n=1 Tax=Helicobacter cholecystus TaxID=45498 RepID=UPI000F71C9EF|nr:NCS2 family permease [Helicobacter cholecystus]VEJ24163.1 transmembrane transport protein [Helicobacter cholecystus]
MNFLDRYFGVSQSGSNFKTEAFAGFTTFISMLYIIPVSASILSDSGMPKEALITAVTLATVIATCLSGLWARVPVAMSVGMGLNVYFSYGMVKGMGLSCEQALGVVFLSGVVFLLISFTKIRTWLINSIPLGLRFALAGGLGAFICTIGLRSLGIITISPMGLPELGGLNKPEVWIGLVGIGVILALSVRKIHASFIIGIVFCSLLAWIFGISNTPKEFFSTPASIAPIAFKMDIMGVFTLALVPTIISLLVLDLFDSLGTLAGVGAKIGLFQNKDGKGDETLEKTLEVDAAATVIGASLGVSTTTSFLESASGVSEGGRTGLTSVFCAFFFACTLFLLPFFLSIPSFAIYPTLIVVGAMMFLEVKHIDFTDLPIGLASFFAIVLMPLTYSIANGLAGGFLVYILTSLALRQYYRINWGVILLGALSIMPIIVHGIFLKG